MTDSSQMFVAFIHYGKTPPATPHTTVGTSRWASRPIPSDEAEGVPKIVEELRLQRRKSPCDRRFINQKPIPNISSTAFTFVRK